MHERKMRSMSGRHKHTENELFEKIAAKFILNLPKDEVHNPLRLPYHYQKAYYFYIDEV